MNREELVVALVLSVPVAVGAAVAVLKTTLGQRPVLAGTVGFVVWVAIFGLVALGVSRRSGGDSSLADIAAAATPTPREATRADLLLGAGLGAIVTVFLWYIPLAPLLGGAVAGAMQGGTREDATRAGLLAGTLVPLVVLTFAGGALLLAGAEVFGRFPFGLPAAAVASVAGIVYSVVFSTIGGRLGGSVLSDRRPWGEPET